MDVGQAETRQTGDLGAIQISAKAQRDQPPLALPEFCQRSLELGIDPQPPPQETAPWSPRATHHILRKMLRPRTDIASVMIDEQIAGDRQQPNPCLTAAGIKFLPGSQRLLESLLGEIFDIAREVSR